MLRRARSHPVLVSGAVAVAWVLTLLVVFQPGYETNDDTSMMSMARGQFAWPSARLVFINVLVGGVLRLGYTWFPDLPWYALVLYAAQILAVATLLYVALTHDWTWRWLGITAVAAILVTFHLPMVVLLQFTSTAMLVCVAGVTLFCRVAPPGSGYWPATFAGLLVGGGSLLRFNAMVGVVALSLPFLVAALRHQRWRNAAVFAGTAAMVSLSGVAVDGWAYRVDPDWDAYREFNTVRGQLHGTPRMVLDERVTSALDDIGWSDNDFRIFRRWFFLDSERYTTEAMHVLVEATEHRAAPRLAPAVVWELVRPGGRHAATWRGFAGELLVCAAIVAAGLVTLRGRRRWLVVAGSVWTLSLLGYLILYSRLPNRVGLPLLMALAMLLALAWGARPPRGRAASLALTGLLVTVLGLSALSTIQDGIARSELHRRQWERLQTVYAGLYDFDPHGVFVSWAGGVPLEWLDPLTEYRDLPPLKRIGVGWPAHSPHHDRLMARHGVTDIYGAIADRDDVYLVTRRQDVVAYLERYLHEHHGRSGCLRRVLNPGSRVVVRDQMIEIETLMQEQGDDLERCLEGHHMTADSG